jgi:hypothetical protein
MNFMVSPLVAAAAQWYSLYMKFAEDYVDEERGRRRAKLKNLAAGALLATGALGVGHHGGRSRGRLDIIKHLEDPQNLAEFALRDGKKLFVATKGTRLVSPLQGLQIRWPFGGKTKVKVK